MNVDPSLLKVLAGAGLGLLLSAGVERFLQPRPLMRRPCGAWQVHLSLWCMAYGLLVLALGRPWCAMVAMSALMITLVLVNNAKRSSLHEPFIFQDYDYFLDALLHPRLFLPFLGVKNFFLAVFFFMLALWGFILERPDPRLDMQGQGGGVLLLLGLAGGGGWRAVRTPLSVTFDPEEDLRRLGLLPSLWQYALAERRLPNATSPLAGIVVRHKPQSWPLSAILPHMVAVQSESFFDARMLFAGVRRDVLSALDALSAKAQAYGLLSVPAWGANTVRTEFAFLTGIAAQDMGVHRFNPYRCVTRGWMTHALPMLLQSLGYHTVCIHPYSARFYGRHRVMPHLGFDTFLDIRSFADARQAGCYVADEEVGDRIMHLLRQAQKPTFIFAITMENHGPLHFERPAAKDAEALYSVPPPEGCHDLTIYLHHLRNANSMLHHLHTALDLMCHPATLCWYGDHVPIMPATYRCLGVPVHVPYACWNNARLQTFLQAEDGYGHGEFFAHSPRGRPLSAHSLALCWLQSTGVCCVKQD